MSMLKRAMSVKKFVGLLMMSVFLALYLPGELTKVEAADTDIVNIPDAVLKAELNDALDVDDETADITQGQLATITGLSAGWYGSYVSDLTGLEYCTNLEWLSIYTQNETMDLSVLSKFSKLTSFTFYGKDIKDVSHIEACQKLTKLNIECKTLSRIPNIPTVTNLSIDTYGTDSKTDLSAIKNMAHMTRLTLQYVKSDDYSAISALTKLTYLEIYESNIVTAPNLSGMTELVTLDLSRNDNLADISGLAGLTSPTYLYFELDYDLMDITPIANMKNLVTLDLEQTGAFDEDENQAAANTNAIAGLTKLQSLYLGYEDVKDSHTYMFNAMNDLTTLVLGYTDVTDLNFLVYHADNLKTLSLYGTDINNEDTAILANMKNLTILGISGTDITDFSFISQLPNLTNNSVRWSEWNTSFRTRTYSQVTKDVLDTVTSITVVNDIKDHNGKIVAPVESTLYTYDAATNTITVPVDMTRTKTSVSVKYEFDMTTQNGKTLYTAHTKNVTINRKKTVAIKTQPKSSIIVEGTSTSMSVVAEGAGTLSYQWYKDGIALTGETGSTINFTNAQVAQSGSYTVKVTDSFSNLNVTSDAAVLTVSPTPITITKQPVGFEMQEGGSGSLSVTAVGGEPYTYQWYKDGVAVAGGTNSTLLFNNIQVSQAGTYTVVITGKSQQTKTSNAVSVKVYYEELELSAKISTSNATTKDKITITATAGGGSRSYTYKYYVYNATTGKYTNLTSYITSNSYAWAPTEAGVYKVYVEVKDSVGTTATSTPMPVTVVYPELKITASTDSAAVISGNKLIITGTATGGTGTYTYSYLIYNKETGAWARLTPEFIASNTYTWTSGVKGERAVYVEVKDSDGNIVRSSVVNITVKQKPLVVTAATSLSEVCTGNKVRITATATGGSEEYTYKYLVYNTATNAWGTLTSGYITDKSFVWTSGSIGTRKVYVEVKDSEGNVARSSAVTLQVIPQPLKITAKSEAATVMQGNKVKITATATGGVKAYTYSYLVHNMENDEWSRLTTFGTSNTFTWTSGSLGNREFFVEVKDSEGTVARSSAVKIEVIPQPLKVTAESNAASVMKGNKVTISATATGGVQGYTYSYLVHNMGTDEWSRLTTFGTSKTFTWTAGSVGNRQFFVEVKDSEGTVVRSSAVKIEVTPQPLKVSAKSDISTVMVGNKINITAVATGGVEEYTYSYMVHNLKTDEWKRLTTFETGKTFSWTAGSVGDREFFVEVKDSTGTVTRSSAVKIEVTPQPLKISAKSDVSTVMQGDKITITASATGGVEAYTYSYLVHNIKTDEWSRLTGFVASNTYSWKAASVANREFFVEVKDSTGVVTRSSAVKIEVTPQPLKVSGASSATAVMKGDKVTITASATGGIEGYTYSYLVYNTKTNEWGRLTSFTKNSSFTWTAGSLGDRKFYVEVKDSTGAVVRSSAIAVEVTPLPLQVTLQGSSSIIKQGNTVKITATATGGTEEYTYHFQIRNMETGTWSILTVGFVEENTFTWTAGNLGVRQVYVDVRDSAGNTVKSSALTITVK